MTRKDSIKRLVGIHGDLLRTLEEKTAEFAGLFPEESELIASPLAGECLSEIVGEIMDRDDWDRTDALALSAGTFLLAVHMQKRDSKDKNL